MFIHIKEEDDLPDLDPNAQVYQGMDLEKHRFIFATATGRDPQEGDLQFDMGAEVDGYVTADIRAPNFNGCIVPSQELIVPKEQWACVEWKMDADATEFSYWVDGVLAQDLQIDKDYKPTQQGVRQCQWQTPPKFKELSIGIFRRHGDMTRTVTVDDFALSVGRIGCGIRRD